MRHFNKILYIGAGAFALSVSPISPLDVVAPVESASAHEVTVISGECTSQTSATFDFSAIYMGDGARDIVVNGPNGTSGKVTTNVDGTHTVTVSGFQPQTGVVNFTWTSTAVTPNGTPPIAVDFSKCTPVVPSDSAAVKAICVENGGAIAITVTLGSNADNVVVYNGSEFELGPKTAGTFEVTYNMALGTYPVIVTVVRNNIGTDVLDTTIEVGACATTTTAATTTTTAATTTTTAATTTTTAATTTTTTTVPPSTGPSTTKPTTSSTLPATGSNPYTDDGVRYALALLVIGIIAVIASVRRKPATS